MNNLPRLLRSPRRAHLILSDGSVFAGFSAGKAGVCEGEVVFNTSMTGYQEMLTDPSYHGQMLVLTAAHVGQTGVNRADAESDRVWARALIVQDFDGEPSSWRAEGPFEAWLKDNGVTVGWGFDTRTIVHHVRVHGTLPGVLVADGSDPDDFRAAAQNARSTAGVDLAREAACRTPYAWTEGPWPGPSHEDREGPLVRVVDFGVKRSILRRLVGEGFRVEVVPPDSGVDSLLASNVAGVVLSNGPGDPAAVRGARDIVSAVAGRKPMLGICLGHQILGLALGGRTITLPFGHHGGNHPVRELATGRVLITAQNHNYAIEEASLPREIEVTHVNLTDGTVEGMALPRLGIESVQFHPEAAPGPNDAAGLFARFAQRCRAGIGRP